MSKYRGPCEVTTGESGGERNLITAQNGSEFSRKRLSTTLRARKKRVDVDIS